MNWKRTLGLLGIAAVLYWMAAGRFVAVNPPEPAPAAAFSLEDTTGKTVSLSDFKGKVVLIDFWATWCAPCLAEIPDLMKLHERFKDQGFSIIGIAVDDEMESVVEFAKERDVPYPLLIEGDEPIEGYRIPGVPTAYLVDREGIVVGQYFGPKSYDMLVRDVQKIL